MGDVRVCIIDRPDRAGAQALAAVAGECRAQVLLPEELEHIDPATEAVFVRAGYWNDVDRLLDLTPRLRWVHIAMAGVDHLLTDRLRASSVVLTNSRGVLDSAIAEFVAAAVLLWSKGLLVSANDNRAGRFRYREPLGNEELTTLVVGAGGIGSACARALRALGAPLVHGVRRSERTQDPAFDSGITFEEAASRLGGYRAVVAALPADRTTEGLLDAAFLAGLGPETVFVNVGRGRTVDNVALARAMADRPGSAAVLDVTEPEPLPEGHPLLACENVVISPHMSGDTRKRHERYAALFLENLARFEAGEPLVNEVGPAAG
ncbi:D-2-hydroxyacid dehydrogenase [Brevibacterium album]|uniref:D-2-hydroxyacid dehydrogenase n=1 Tax=Brevibacterium album TaxID=417948 RepID=UPI00041F9B1C|nr:D-2-hydroxyacid dehydrogenase [Brevibacterium album]